MKELNFNEPIYNFKQYVPKLRGQKKLREVDKEIIKWLLRSGVAINTIVKFSNLKLNYTNIRKIKDDEKN